MQSPVRRLAFILGLGWGCLGVAATAQAQVVVSDPGLLLEVVNQKLQQVEQYKTQLESYELQVRDKLAPAAWLWDQSQIAIDQVTRLIEFANVTRLKAEDIDAYLSRFKSVDYYRNSPCFKNKGCSKEEMELFQRGRAWSLDTQKAANEEMFRDLDKEYDRLQEDAAHLRKVQLEARTAKGQLQALGYANQLAAAQAAQLLQLRGLLMAQHRADIKRRQAEGNRKALEEAAAQHLRSGKYTPSPKREWGFQG